MGETAREGASQIFPPPSGFSAKYMRNVMDLSWYNDELEAKFLSEEELELLKQLRS